LEFEIMLPIRDGHTSGRQIATTAFRYEKRAGGPRFCRERLNALRKSDCVRGSIALRIAGAAKLSCKIAVVVTSRFIGTTFVVG
jgi:hypothetical protein